MPRMTLEKLGDMVATQFADLHELLNTKFGQIDRRFECVEFRLDRMETRMNRMERGQEDILLKLDNKADKIDFPDAYPSYRSR